MNITAYGQTDVGRTRRHNEDAFIIEKEQLLFALADGMGGAAAGEVASHIFTEKSLQTFLDSVAMERCESLIRRAFYVAHDAIHHYTELHPETEGMGCTAEILSFENGQYYIGHVGDSRSYLIRDDKLIQLTEDHSFIQSQINQGILTAEDAKTHVMRNAINRAVGQTPPLRIDLISDRAMRRDVFLLCSDGLSDMLTDEQILALAGKSHQSLEERTQQLIDAANDQGGRDNITVVLCALD